MLDPAIRFADEIEPAPLRWLWAARIPRGALTLLVGDPGVGKSLLAADLAARLSSARPFPGAVHPGGGTATAAGAGLESLSGGVAGERATGHSNGSAPGEAGVDSSNRAAALESGIQDPQPSTRTYPAGVVIASAEDRPATTLVPRLAAAGADLTRICILEGVTEIPLHSRDPSVFDKFAQGHAAPAPLAPDPSICPRTPTCSHRPCGRSPARRW